MSSFEIKCPLMFDMSFNVTVCGQPLIPAHDPDPSSAETTDDTVTFSFDQPSGRLEHTKPVSLTLPDGTIPVNSWTLVLKECVSYAFQNNRKKIESLRDVEAPFRKSILFSSTPGNMRKPEQLSADLYMETHFSAFDIVKFVRGLMDYCGFPSHEFAISYRKILSSANTPKKDFDENSPESAFVKQLDFSTFTSGITIPISCHQVFLSHLSGNLNRGESHPVTIKIGNQSFNVMITNVGFSDSSRPTYLKFYWHRNSPIAKSFQATFPAAYQQLSEDHSSRDGIDTELTVSCGEQPDIFQIAMDTPLVESKEPDVPAQVETVAPALPEASAPNDIHGICIQEDWIRFDFTNAPSFEGTVPAYCCIDGNVFEGRNWVRILVALVEFELAKGNPALEDLYEKPLYCKKSKRPFLLKSRIAGKRYCSELSNGYW
ncbi:MAG: hypothetical protein IKO93_06030, partial [Lentisphaeria bacterium]|nr:hypothetical protein [Lentisphaeria bacterium]